MYSIIVLTSNVIALLLLVVALFTGDFGFSATGGAVLGAYFAANITALGCRIVEKD